ncbi:hypothetical protein [Streptomyces sp. SPB162]|uniref:hypothetical protein n=1 Tax=Streptomyces sp. SPB162 TaxID=2940560 RepID=UPI002406025B|nr:hypothetical protein [Streptomyces sp. SPB162]MDF9810934.1 hypothetical protein [Streptomyces sp. SPB162]
MVDGAAGVAGQAREHGRVQPGQRPLGADGAQHVQRGADRGDMGQPGEPLLQGGDLPGAG